MGCAVIWAYMELYDYRQRISKAVFVDQVLVECPIPCVHELIQSQILWKEMIIEIQLAEYSCHPLRAGTSPEHSRGLEAGKPWLLRRRFPRSASDCTEAGLQERGPGQFGRLPVSAAGAWHGGSPRCRDTAL